MSDLIQVIGDSNCGDCSQSIKIKGCSNNVPYLQIVTSTGISPATVTFINLVDGAISATAPVGYVTGDCPAYEEVDLVKTNWLPICVAGVQWYVLESSTYNNATATETTPVKLYKQGANGTIVTTAPTDTIVEGICTIPQIDIETRTICNETTNTWHYITLVYTNGLETSNTSINSGISCSEPLPINPDIEQLRRCNAATNTIWIDVIRYMTDPITNVTTNSILSSVDTLERCNQAEIDYIHTNWLPICVNGVQWYVAEEYDFNNTTGVKTLVGKIYKNGANGAVVTVAPTGTIVDGECKLKTQRIHQNFVITGTTPLVIPSGAISISVTKTNNTGVVNISGDNSTDFPLTFNRENFGDAVNEGYSTLSAYTITGTLTGTTYKVHIIR